MSDNNPYKIHTPCKCGHPPHMHVEVVDREGVVVDSYCWATGCDLACGSVEEPEPAVGSRELFK